MEGLASGAGGEGSGFIVLTSNLSCRHRASLELFYAILALSVFAVWASATLPTSCLATAGGSGNCLVGAPKCAWQKHGSCDTRLAEACPPKL